MATVNLINREKEHIVSVDIPPFATLPEVIVWDTRVFKLWNSIGVGQNPDYLEVPAWFYLTPLSHKQVV